MADAASPAEEVAAAIRYMQEQWPALCVFLKNPKLEISNASPATALRPFVGGRNDWVFVNTANGAQGSMILYSLIETARANGLVPLDYIANTLKRLPHAHTKQDIDALLPLGIMG